MKNLYLSLVLVLFILHVPFAFAVQCSVSRLQIDREGKKTPPDGLEFVEFQENQIFAKNNPDRVQLNETDLDFPYGFSITYSKITSDISIVIRQKKNRYSSSSSEGAFNSDGKYHAGITINSATLGQDLFQIDCKKE